MVVPSGGSGMLQQGRGAGPEYRPDHSTRLDLWELACKRKAGRMPETFLSREPAPGSGGPVQDTLRVHPCKLDFGHPWPKTVLDGPTRSRRSLGDSKLPYLEGQGEL